MQKHPTLRILFFVAFLSIATRASTNVPRTETKTFVQTTHPTWKAMYEGRRLVALFGGTGIAKDARTAEQFVLDFPNDNKAAFGVAATNSTFEHKETRVLNSGKKVYTFAQKINGLPVHGSTVRVVANDAGTVIYVGLKTVPSPYPAGFPANQFTEQQAKQVILDSPAYDGIDTFTTGQEVVVEDTHESLHKVWRFGGWGGGQSYQFFVDTNSGQIVEVIDGFFDVDVSGQIKGKTTTNLDVYNGSNLASQAAGLPGILVRSATQCDSTSSVASEYACPDPTDNPPSCTDGSYAMSGVSDQHFIAMALDGRWAKVRSCECQVAGSGVNELVVCVNHAINDQCAVWRQCGDVPNQSTWVYSPSFDPSTSTEFRVAQVNAFVTIEKAHGWFSDLLTAPLTGINIPLSVGVNAPTPGSMSRK